MRSSQPGLYNDWCWCSPIHWKAPPVITEAERYLDLKASWYASFVGTNIPLCACSVVLHSYITTFVQYYKLKFILHLVNSSLTKQLKVSLLCLLWCFPLYHLFCALIKVLEKPLIWPWAETVLPNCYLQACEGPFMHNLKPTWIRGPKSAVDEIITEPTDKDDVKQLKVLGIAIKWALRKTSHVSCDWDDILWHLQSPDVCIVLIIFLILCRVVWSISRDCNKKTNVWS